NQYKLDLYYLIKINDKIEGNFVNALNKELNFLTNNEYCFFSKPPSIDRTKDFPQKFQTIRRRIQKGQARK
ncbi:MAG: Asp-tRNA(Asn)/Glu-tRNA(Gln) amidotransferase GatCAB subunit C, partial [Sweet potato little leaf phytoplasma]|nr:Asp-tRNA(Asn)/Glu-tRNA(Gln) amidotransferase GatCAB subunit C [Sweet potato little leaf phytoplasma]